METKVLTYKEPKLNQPQSKSLTYYVQRIEELQVASFAYFIAYLIAHLNLNQFILLFLADY